MQLLIVLGGGGHTEQMLKLVDKFEKKYDYEYVITNVDSVSKKRIKILGKIWQIYQTRGAKTGIVVATLKCIVNLVKIIPIMFQTKAKAIISCGAGDAIPICIIGKLFGKKIIFLESWSRVYSKSISGKVIYKFADLFFVQWPEMQKLYPKAIYAGRLG